MPNIKFWEIFSGDIFGRYFEGHYFIHTPEMGDIFGENGRYFWKMGDIFGKWEIFYKMGDIFGKWEIFYKMGDIFLKMGDIFRKWEIFFENGRYF